MRRTKMRHLIIVGLVLVVAISMVGCTQSEPKPFPPPEGYSSSGKSYQKQTDSLSYEVVRTYTEEVIVGTKPVGMGSPLTGSTSTGSAVDLRNKACVEIKNTSNMAGLFSIKFSFSEEYFGRDLIYLEPGETGVVSYIPFHTYEDFKQGLSDKEFNDKTVEWEYEITPVVLNPAD
jgi:hypothetical protein